VCDPAGEGRDWLACGEGEIVHAWALGGRPEEGALPLAAIVFPRWAADAKETFEPLPGPTVTRLLMELLANARNLTGHGLPEIARIARAVPGFRLEYSSVEIAERFIASTLE